MSGAKRTGRHEPEASGQPTRHAPRAIPPGDQELLHELWLISHFGWMAYATICRTLIISGAEETLASGLADRLRQLLTAGGSSSATPTPE